MKTKTFSRVLIGAIAIVASAGVMSAPTHHDKYEGVQATEVPMLDGGKTIIGQSFNYPTGAPKLQTYNVRINPGKPTNMHKHSIPVLVQVVSGQLEVDYGSKGKRTIKKGEAYVEAINWCHQGLAAAGQPVTVQVTYLGQEGADTIKPTECTKLD